MVGGTSTWSVHGLLIVNRNESGKQYSLVIVIKYQVEYGLSAQNDQVDYSSTHRHVTLNT